MKRHLLVLAGLALAGLLPREAAAAPSPGRPGMRALVVGSNRSGPGQEELRFAEDDARRFADVLVELGGYDRARVTVAQAPDRARLLALLAVERAALQAERDAGTPSVFTFFYSGHARASALSLGAEELPLGELREQLLSLPATVRVAILDACQTGAISHIKGASPARDFSFNSVSDLHAEGAAIMASSTASELSQESETLRSSFFTHHLVVGLRGAADADLDGRVTLGEAYQYAYHRTLAATASTAVGAQHATLENDLKGRGEMVLTWPARASAQLELAAAMRAEVLVQRDPAGTVVAELSKAPGSPLRVALPPGRYAALVRSGARARRCELVLREDAATPLLPEGCPEVAVEQSVSKAAERRAAWGLELLGGAIWTRADGFNHTLDQFGFEGGSPSLTGAGSLAVTRALGRYLTVVLRFDTLEVSGASRDVRTAADPARTTTFDWQTFGLGAFLRVGYPFREGLVTPYLQAGGGLSLGFTRYVDKSLGQDDRQVYAGYQLAALAGLELMPWRSFGFLWQLGYGTAPAVRTLLGDVHDSGGAVLLTGLRAGF